MLQKCAGSIPNGEAILCLKTMVLMVKRHLFMVSDIALTRVSLVNYLLQLPLKVK